MSDQLIDMLKRHEDVRLTTYRDTVGVLTIGVGHALPDGGRALKVIGRELHEGSRLTPMEVGDLLTADIGIARADLIAHYPPFAKLDYVRQCVMVDMCFNLGWTRLSGFKDTLALIAASKYQDAAMAMLDSKWATQVGKRAKELSLMMGTGKWQ